MKTHPLLLILCAVCLTGYTAGCRQGQRASVLSEPEFARVYADLAVAGFVSRSTGADSLTSASRADSILANDGVTREQFQATAQWYNKDVQRWKPLFDDVVRILDDTSRHAGP